MTASAFYIFQFHIEYYIYILELEAKNDYLEMFCLFSIKASPSYLAISDYPIQLIEI